MPRVSVFMPSYNHADYVEAALKSVQQQTFQDLEIVVSDDGSTDETPDVIAAFDDPRVRLNCFPVNRGAAFATNDAIRRCSGEYLALLNSDDVFLPHKLERQVAFLDAHPRVGAVFGYPQFIDQHGKHLDPGNTFNGRVFEVENRSQVAWLRHFFMQGNCLCHPTMMIRRECYEKVGLYDARFANLPDFHMWMRLVTAYPIHILAERLTGFRVLPNSANASAPRLDSVLRDQWEQVRSRSYYVELPQDMFEAVFAPEIASLSLDRRLDRKLSLGQICLASDRQNLQRLGLELMFDGLPPSPADTDPRYGHAKFHREVGQRDVFNLLQRSRANQFESELLQIRRQAVAPFKVDDMPQVTIWVVPVRDKLKINLGCGPTIIPEWINLDREPGPGAHFWDGTQGIPSGAGSVSFIYMEHFIEHLNLEEGLSLLRECVGSYVLGVSCASQRLICVYWCGPMWPVR